MGSLSICPAYAGVILMFPFKRKHKINLSRVCGGDPDIKLYIGKDDRFVPRMRG